MRGHFSVQPKLMQECLTCSNSNIFMSKLYKTVKHALCGALILSGMAANGQSFSWIKNAGDNDRFTFGQGIVVDHHHNEVVSGFQNDSTHFGSLVMPFYGDIDAYLAKYDSAGNLLWARTIWGPNNEKAFHVAVDTADNIYVVGGYSSPFVHFTATDSMSLMAAGSTNFFLAKYDKNGTFLWARNGGTSLTTPRDCKSFAVTVDPWGNAVIGGYYQDDMTISGTPLSGGAQNLFLAKYTPTGTCLWAKPLTSNSMCWVSAITTDDTGNIYPTGKFCNKLYIGTTVVANNSMGDAVFYGKFDPMGNMIWMDSIINNESASTSDNNFNCGNSILVDHAGYVYLGGSILDTVIIMSGPSLHIEQDGFIAKYDNAGNQQWMQRFGAHKRDVINGIAFDAAGKLYAIGSFVGPTSIGGMSLTLPTYGYGDIFVGKFDPATGNALWLKTGGGLSVSANVDMGADISIDQQTGDIATTGYFENKIRFDALLVTSLSTTLSFLDMYVARQSNPVVPSLGMTTTQHEASYAMYPNPATNMVHIDLADATYHTVMITDMAGRVVKQVSTTTNMLTLDIQELSAGTYTVSVMDAGQNAKHRKLVKK